MNIDTCEILLTALTPVRNKSGLQRLGYTIDHIKNNPTRTTITMLAHASDNLDAIDVADLNLGMLIGVSVAYASDDPKFKEYVSYMYNKMKEIREEKEKSK